MQGRSPSMPRDSLAPPARARARAASSTTRLAPLRDGAGGAAKTASAGGAQSRKQSQWRARTPSSSFSHARKVEALGPRRADRTRQHEGEALGGASADTMHSAGSRATRSHSSFAAACFLTAPPTCRQDPGAATRARAAADQLLGRADQRRHSPIRPQVCPRPLDSEPVPVGAARGYKNGRIRVQNGPMRVRLTD